MKILLIEDSIDFLNKMKSFLEDMEYEVVTAMDGLEGIEMIKKHPDLVLIISDVNMPNLDGISMCKRIRKEQLQSPPIMMVTTEGSKKLRKEGEEVGVNYWLIKPVPQKMLISMVEKILNQENS